MQSHPDGQCLRYPEPIPPQREVSYENAMNMLLRATSMAQNVPFAWGYIDKPQDGTVLLLYLPPGTPYPNDGIRYLDTEAKATIPAGARELEVCEIKFGFIPGAQEPSASRVRRRYRLLKGGISHLLLVHYTRGQQTLIQPNMNQPVRAYPLRPLNDQPSVFVAGERQGQKVYPPGMHPGQGPTNMPPATIGLNMGLNQQQAMLAQQNSQMEALERRRERERERERAQQSSTAARAQQRMAEEPESDDEVDSISTRTLALARYKRNHDWMNEVFHQAAFGSRTPAPKPAPYSIFKKTDLEEKTARLQAELEALQSKSDQRRADLIRASQNQDAGDISMGTAESIAV